MATNLISAEVSAEKNKFQEMRENLNQKFSELTSLVNQRKLELDRKIDDLEIEYNNKNKQIEKDKQTLKELREITEQKLGQNTLLDVQNNIIKEISDKIQKLDAESNSQLEFALTLNWDFTKIKQEIDRIDLKLAPIKYADTPLIPDPPPNYPTSPRNYLPPLPNYTPPLYSFPVLTPPKFSAASSNFSVQTRPNFNPNRKKYFK